MMETTKKPISILAILFLVPVLLLPTSVNAEVIVIANNDIGVDSVSGGNLKKIFLGKTATWSDGSTISPTVIEKGSTTDEFLKSYVKKSPSQFKAFWKKAVFTGTGTPPECFKTDAELVAYVANTAGAIGFIDSESPHDGVKILTVN